ncbi:hypothetical protein [Ureibacillus manganicus]|uniref:Uncharacterized protein n=1 Tax=Ureibacillus manganicus DSM 26584 TaxID=1384049 RepID=A0A0A3HQW4_9BACL|nr:hypothetical protein [Ureibacillus manganicus]KGR73625.1 hypothetical protein CD29_19195 [Ureibacillus manganicus DSM 26584]
MKKEKRNFEEKYSNNWLCILTEIKGLKKVLLSKTTEEVRFWLDGTWIIGNDTEFSRNNDDVSLVLTKDELEYINQDNIDNVLYNICYLINHALCGLDVHEHLLHRKETDLKNFLQENLYKSKYRSYNFVYTYEDIDFKCKIDWELSGRYFTVSLDDETLGVSEGIGRIISYLFDLAEELQDEEQAFTLFCREIRKLEAYYCNSTNKFRSQTTTPTEVLILQGEMTSAPIMGNYIKVADIIDYFQLNIPMPNEAVKNKYLDYHDLFDTTHDLCGYLDVGDIESYIYWFVENNDF